MTTTAIRCNRSDRAEVPVLSAERATGGLLGRKMVRSTLRQSCNFPRAGGPVAFDIGFTCLAGIQPSTSLAMMVFMISEVPP